MSTDTNNPQDPSSEAAAEISPKEVQVIIPFPDSFVYSNVCALSCTSMDMRLGFGEAMPDGHAQPRVGIVMPAEAAAQLVLNMLQQIQFFERNFGEIRHPQWRAFQAQAKANADAMKKIRDVPSKPQGSPPPEEKS